MRRLIISLAAITAVLGLTAGPAAAMQPPGPPAQQHFGCPDPVGGHPGAAGIVDATARVNALTGNPMPTAWNAVYHADPIVLGEC